MSSRVPEVLRDNVAAVRNRIRIAAGKAGRSADDVQLIAVTKTVPASIVTELAKIGLRDFGENRLQVALPKLDTLMGELPEDVRWHFIGHIQKNKARRIAESFDVIHSIDSLALGRTLGAAAQKTGRALDVFLQVNVSHEPQKHGFHGEELESAIVELREMGGLRMLGLMAMAQKMEAQNRPDDIDETRTSFADLRNLASNLLERGILPDGAIELSMGMTDDFEIAIEEGATRVRVGRALYCGLEVVTE